MLDFASTFALRLSTQPHYGISLFQTSFLELLATRYWLELVCLLAGFLPVLANGILDKKDTGKKLIMLVDSLFASLAILSEERVWDYNTAAMIGENINEVKRLVLKKFGMKTEQNG